MSLPEYLMINGTNYATEKFSDAAKSQLANVQIVDTEIGRLQQQLTIAQTARNACVAALVEAVKTKEDTSSDEKPKKARSPRKAATPKT